MKPWLLLAVVFNYLFDVTRATCHQSQVVALLKNIIKDTKLFAGNFLDLGFLQYFDIIFCLHCFGVKTRDLYVLAVFSYTDFISITATIKPTVFVIKL